VQQEDTRGLFVAIHGSKEQKMNKRADGHESILQLHHLYIVKDPLYFDPHYFSSPQMYPPTPKISD